MDSNFDRAWAALADTYVLIPEYFAGPMDQYVPLAREAIEKTLAINPRSAHGLTTSAYLKYMFEYDFEGAQNDFLKAIEIDPSYATAHQWYGELLSVLRKPDAAIAELKLARQLDPLSPVIPHVMGWVLAQTDRTEEAYRYYQEALEIDPHFRGTIGNLVGLNMKTGRFDEARKRALEIAGLTTQDPPLPLAIIDALENPEKVDIALDLLMNNSVSPSGITGKAVFLLYLGEDEMALDVVEKSFSDGDPYAVHMNRLGVYERVRDHPRFQALLEQMNLLP